ncbi:MAG: O-antigen ligase family protein [Chitinophagales bacterium]|jgi:hypothetical protein|nr:O-antigen ligase family protein [Chitinophagales bacterium]
MLSAWMYFGAFIVYFRLSDIEHTLLSGQSFLQAPFSHIRFNFIVFLAWFIGVVQLISFANKKKRILITITISSIYLVFLANRSVQLMFFLSLIFFFLELVKSSKRKSIFVLSGLGIFFIMIVCISQTEIWAYKLRFLIYQFEIFQSLDNRNFNDINRYYSILDGINLIKKNPAFGVGLGDIASEIKALNPDLSPTLPHNQFVYIWASAGFHSLFAFISFLIALLVQFKKNKNYYNLWMLFLILLFMMIEFPLQVQFGILFISLMIHFPYENYSRIHHL